MSLVTQISDYQTALDFLYGRINYERQSDIPYRSNEFKLDRMRFLLELLENPHLGMPVVHVAGTKGKGSTSWMIASALTAAGYRTGLYTSPHLERLEERFQVDGVQCSSNELIELSQELQTATSILDGQSKGAPYRRGATFFEITTSMAFRHFEKKQVDVAVMEVGLGGRLDSTNVCEPEVCAITSISFDHTKQLGFTLSSIAREKAGIIKPKVPTICGVRAAEPLEVIEEIASRHHAPLLRIGREFCVHAEPPEEFAEATRFDFHTRGGEHPSISFEQIETPLLGRHQADNGAVATMTLLTLANRGWRVTEDAIRKGLRSARPAARLELVTRRPYVVLDASHNVASIQSMCDAVGEHFPAKRRILVFAGSRDKDLRGMLSILAPFFDDFVLTRFIENPRAYSPETISETLASVSRETYELAHDRRIFLADDPMEAMAQARSLATPEDLICVAGSFFLAAELRANLLRGV